jgi:hypothetical protein
MIYLVHRPGCQLFLGAEAVGAYGTGTSSNCFEGVFDLKQLIVSFIPPRCSQLTCPSGEKTVKAIISVVQVLQAPRGRSKRGLTSII